MDKFFGNLHAVLGAGLVLAIILMLCLNGQNFEDGVAAGNAIMRWLHTFFGVLWIGLLYYFNFVQMPTMPKIPAELKPAVGKHIAPEALFWFRWAALATVVFGVGVLFTRGHAYAHEVLTFGLAGGLNAGDQQFTLMGIGVWLAIIMFLNVWGVIWPNQKRALGIVAVDDDKKAKAARIAMLGSRTNLLLSLPMLTSMAMYQTLFG